MLTNIKNIHEGTRYRIKDREKAEVFHYICQHPGVTRKEIVKITNIRPSTVSSIVGELLTQNMVYEEGRKSVAEKGRPEIPLYSNLNRFLSIALYVVSQKVKGVLLNFNGDILEEESVGIPMDVENDEMLDVLKKLILSLAAKTPANATLLGVGLSMMGSLSHETGELFDSSRWSRLKKISVLRLGEMTGLKCTLYNTLSAELTSLLINNPEYRSGITMLYHWGYGIGLKVAYNGKVLSSRIGSTGEAGHIVVNRSNGKPCRCGKIGCLETEAALWSLVPQLEKDFPGIPNDEVDFYKYSASRNLFDEPLIRKAAGYIIENLNLVYLLLAPDRIILTGPFVNNESIITGVRNEFYKNLSGTAKDKVTMEVLGIDFAGEVFGTTYPLFHEAYRKELLRF